MRQGPRTGQASSSGRRQLPPCGALGRLAAAGPGHRHLLVCLSMRHHHDRPCSRHQHVSHARLGGGSLMAWHAWPGGAGALGGQSVRPQALTEPSEPRGMPSTSRTTPLTWSSPLLCAPLCVRARGALPVAELTTLPPAPVKRSWCSCCCCRLVGWRAGTGLLRLLPLGGGRVAGQAGVLSIIPGGM